MREWQNEASSATAEDFAYLLGEVERILSEEQKRREGSGLVFIPAREICGRGKDGESESEGEAKIMVVGDIHGDLESLSRIIEDFFAINPSKIIFLGDYGDRGDESVEVYYTLFKFKIFVDGSRCSESFERAAECSSAAKLGSESECESRVILLRGNHEGPPDLPVSPHELPYLFGRKFGAKGRELYLKVKTLWEFLPHAAFIECLSGGGYLLTHGGIPQDATSLNDISEAHRRHPHTSELEEILWSDPFEGEGCTFSLRGAGKNFGTDISERVLRALGVKTLVRSHEPCEDGVEVLHNGRILTIFSRKGAPYFNSHAAYLLLDEDALETARNAYELATKTVRW